MLIALSLTCAVAGASPAAAQEPVTAVSDAESLFTSPDPQLNANKQVVYHILRDLLEAGHWELAERYLSPEYIQHNPNVPSGRDAAVHFFTQILKMKPHPIPARLGMKITSVTAEADLVVVTYPREVEDPKDPTHAVTTTWFDMWRIHDGKAVEHWDPAMPDEGP